MIPAHVQAAAWDVVGPDVSNVQGGLDLVEAYYESLILKAVAVADNVIGLLSVVDHPAATASAQILAAAVAEVASAT